VSGQPHHDLGAPRAVLSELPGPDGAPIRIRHPAPDDAAAFLAYLRRVGAESDFLTFGGEGPPMSEAEQRAFLASVGTLGNAFMIVAEWNGEIVGSLGFKGGNRIRTRHVGEFGITVARSCQGVGLGRRLMELLIAWARNSGVVRKINLLVRTDNTRAIALYESLGFEVEGRNRRDMLVNGTFHDAYLMGLLVDPAPGSLGST
jgi:RimJ/RimL family protein N-acetyltransferase